MELIELYECLCDKTRLRIVNLLAQTSLCVCHIQEVLGETQVKISKHLSYMRERGLVQAQRKGNWMVYSLTENSPILELQLESLKESFSQEMIFIEDTKRLPEVVKEVRC